MKKKISKILIIAMCISMIGVLTACGNKENKNEKYIVSTEATYPPFDTTDDNGELTGFDMELVKAIADDQGFEVEFQPLEFDALIPALDSDSTDIVAAALTISDDRQKEVEFSDGYYETGTCILVNKNNTNITDWDSFSENSGLKVAAQTGTAQADTAKELKKEGKVADAVTLNQVTTALQQLQNGDIDAVILDKPVATEIQNSQGDKFKMVGGLYSGSEGVFGLAVKKGNDELVEKLNKGLKNIKDNGKYDKLCKKWDIEVK